MAVGLSPQRNDLDPQRIRSPPSQLVLFPIPQAALQRVHERDLSSDCGGCVLCVCRPSRRQLVELFYEVDKDKSGWLSEEEAFSCLVAAWSLSLSLSLSLFIASRLPCLCAAACHRSHSATPPTSRLLSVPVHLSGTRKPCDQSLGAVSLTNPNRGCVFSVSDRPPRSTRKRPACPSSGTLRCDFEPQLPLTM